MWPENPVETIAKTVGGGGSVPIGFPTVNDPYQDLYLLALHTLHRLCQLTTVFQCSKVATSNHCIRMTRFDFQTDFKSVKSAT